MSLDSLPDELLDKIIAIACVHPPTAHSLRLSSKSLLSLATPYRFTTVTLNGNKELERFVSAVKAGSCTYIIRNVFLAVYVGDDSFCGHHYTLDDRISLFKEFSDIICPHAQVLTCTWMSDEIHLFNWLAASTFLCLTHLTICNYWADLENDQHYKFTPASFPRLSHLRLVYDAMIYDQLPPLIYALSFLGRIVVPGLTHLHFSGVRMTRRTVDGDVDALRAFFGLPTRERVSDIIPLPQSIRRCVVMALMGEENFLPYMDEVQREETEKNRTRRLWILRQQVYADRDWKKWWRQVHAGEANLEQDWLVEG